MVAPWVAVPWAAEREVLEVDAADQVVLAAAVDLAVADLAAAAGLVDLVVADPELLAEVVEELAVADLVAAVAFPAVPVAAQAIPVAATLATKVQEGVPADVKATCTCAHHPEILARALRSWS